MDQQDKFRTQTGMILQALERDLGEYVSNNKDSIETYHTGVIKKIKERHPNFDTIDDATVFLIENSYFNEVWELASLAAKDQHHKAEIQRFQKVAETLDIYDIRNAVAHPNKPFPETYWRRATVFGTDPACEVLGFRRTIRALRQAEEGVLEELSQAWLDSIVWRLTNNLPETVDFESTGLIGREKEVKELNALIRNTRIPLIAVVAPGGVGKTALVLKVLHDLVHRPDSANFCQGIAYVSLKTEYLTENGVVRDKEDPSEQDIRLQVSESLGEVIDKQLDGRMPNDQEFGDMNQVLLCIDNVENILRESPEDFLKIYDELPLNIRVIVTSRVTVDGSRSFPLESLKQSQAERLARKYAVIKGLKEISSDRIEYISQNAGKNPLAIRLSIDLYARGYDVPYAVSRASKDIAEFSFRNLLETLDENTLYILELLFLRGGQMADEISMILESSRDEIVEALNILKRTSLLIREEGEFGDSFSINPAVKDFLLTSAKNVRIREEVRQRLTRLARVDKEVATEQADRGVDVYRWYYIPDDTPAALKEVLRGCSKALNSANPQFERVAQIYRELNGYQDNFGSYPVFNAYIGKCYEGLAAHDDAERHISAACERSDREPRYVAMLGRFYHQNHQFGKAEECYQELIDRGYLDRQNADVGFASTVLIGKYLAKIFDHRYAEVLADTKNWKKSSEFWRLLGTFRASAIKREAEHKALDEKFEAVRRALKIFDDILGSEGDIPGTTSKIFVNVVQELEYLVRNPGFDGFAK